MIGVADGHGQSVSGIAARCAAETKQGADHVLDLPFFGLSVSGHSLFDLPGCIIIHRQALLHNCCYSGASGLAQLEGGAHIMGGEQILHRCDFRLVLLQNLGKPLKDHQQAAGKISFFICADGAAGDKAETRSLLVYDSVAGDPGTGINTDNPYRPDRPE
jgi:hypothetical protein